MLLLSSFTSAKKNVFQELVKEVIFNSLTKFGNGNVTTPKRINPPSLSDVSPLGFRTAKLCGGFRKLIW